MIKNTSLSRIKKTLPNCSCIARCHVMLVSCNDGSKIIDKVSQHGVLTSRGVFDGLAESHCLFSHCPPGLWVQERTAERQHSHMRFMESSQIYVWIFSHEPYCIEGSFWVRGPFCLLACSSIVTIYACVYKKALHMLTLNCYPLQVIYIHIHSGSGYRIR